MQVDMNFEWDKYLWIVEESKRHAQHNAYSQQQQELHKILLKHIHEYNKSILETAKKNCTTVMEQKIIDKAIEENIDSLDNCHLGNKIFNSFVKVVGPQVLEHHLSNYDKMINQINHDFNPDSIKPNISHAAFYAYLSSMIRNDWYRYPNDQHPSANMTKIEFIGNAQEALKETADVIKACIETCLDRNFPHEFISEKGWAEIALPQGFETQLTCEEESASITGDVSLEESTDNTQ